MNRNTKRVTLATAGVIAAAGLALAAAPSYAAGSGAGDWTPRPGPSRTAVWTPSGGPGTPGASPVTPSNAVTPGPSATVTPIVTATTTQPPSASTCR